MSATTTRKTSKAAQDKEQREAKAKAAAAGEQPSGDEASEAELAAQKGRPSNEQPAADDASPGNAPDADPVPDDGPEAPAPGTFGSLPKAGSGRTSRPSAWTDRLNGVAENQAAADEAEAAAAKAAKRAVEPQYAYVHQTGTPATATSVTSDVRKKLTEGRIGGLVGEGTFDLKTRGRMIYARFIPAGK